MRIKIEGVEYDLNVNTALACGHLKKVHWLDSHVFQAGDVFYLNEWTTFWLVKVAYRKDEWQLLGLGGCTVNSNTFFDTTHTIEEIRRYLRAEKNVEFKGNMRREVSAVIGARV